MAEKISYKRRHKGLVYNLPYRSNAIAWYVWKNGMSNIGGKCNSWKDNSGNNNPLLQANASAQPSFTSEGSLAFTPNNFLQANFNLAQPSTVVMAVAQNAWNANAVIVDGGGNAARISQVTASPQIAANAGVQLTADANIPLNKMSVLAFVMNGNASLYNGAGGAPVLTIAGNAGSNSPGGITIGANFSGGNGATITVREVVVYNRALSANELQQAVRYMSRVAQVGGV